MKTYAPESHFLPWDAQDNDGVYSRGPTKSWVALLNTTLGFLTSIGNGENRVSFLPAIRKSIIITEIKPEVKNGNVSSHTDIAILSLVMKLISLQRCAV